MEEAQIKFEQFAEQTLTNHLGELNTRYDNTNNVDPDLISQAFIYHSQIFERELDDKIDELLDGDIKEQRTSFLEMKQAYLLKLNENKGVYHR